ncbi:unnamed protein product, partial [Symbiodinium necroappetens]
MNEGHLDGAITWEEAISNTDGLKVLQLDRPMIVHKDVGCVKVGDLPAQDEITADSIKKKVQFLDIMLDYEGEIDLKHIETLFLQQRYADLPSPIRVNSRVETPYNMQLFILPADSGKHHIVKHIKFSEGTKVFHSTIRTMCTGQALEINYNQNYREGGRALQYLLEGLGGFQVRYQKLVPAGGPNKQAKETNEIRTGFAFIRKEGPEENSDGQFTFWTEEQVNDPNSPIYKWDRSVVKEFLRCLADQGSQAKSITDWPLTLKSLTPWCLNEVIAPILPHVLEHAVIWIGKSYVGKKEKGRRTKPRVFDDGNLNLEHPAAVKAVTEVSGIDRKTMARWNAASYAKNQLCQVCSNPYDRSVEPDMPPNTNSDTIPFEVFFKLVRPSFHKDFDEEDLMAIFKRSLVVVFTEKGIYTRLPSINRDPVKRVAWPDKDIGMISLSARPVLSAYYKSQLANLPNDHESDMQWSLNLLQAALDKEDVQFCSSIIGKEFSTGRRYLQEARPTLAGISGTTFHYYDEVVPEAAPPVKRLKSVMSSHSLLSRDLEQDAAKAESEQDATKPEAEEVKPTVTIKQEQIEANTKFTAFKKKLGKRTLQISISDESTTPPGRSSAAPSAKAMEILTATDRGILDMLRKDKLIGDWSE